MAEAPITLSPTPPSTKALAQLRVTLAFAAHTRTRQVAMNHAKRKLQAQGLSVSAFTHRELVLKAEEYLAQHREELIADARKIVARWQAEGVFGKRGGIHFTRRASLRNNDQPKAR
jgi:hypothetical protein